MSAILMGYVSRIKKSKEKHQHHHHEHHLHAEHHVRHHSISPAPLAGAALPRTPQQQMRNREHLLAQQETSLLLDPDSKLKTTGVVRRDKERAQRPLTRYLPIRSQDFDLRQHVESAGHQIELCHHVRIDSTSCRGYLHKLGGKWHTWKKRWFIFDRVKRALIYCSDKSETKLRGVVSFQAIEEVYVDHLHSVKSPHPQATFCMKTYDRVYYLMAPTAEAMRIWVDVIFTGAEGYLEFLAEGEQ